MEYTALSLFPDPELIGFARTPADLERLILRVSSGAFVAFDVVSSLPRSGRILIPRGYKPHPLIRPALFVCEYDAGYLARDLIRDGAMRYGSDGPHGNKTEKGWEVRRLYVNDRPVPLLYAAWVPSNSN